MLTIEQIQSIESPDSSSPANGQIFYEMRLRNTGAKPISLPTNPDRDQVIAQCGTSPMVESGIAIEAKESTSAKSPTPGQWQDYYGCAQIGSTMILVVPGEWITYRGTTTIPTKVAQTAPLEGSWVLSKVRYISVANGLREDSDLVLSVHSEAQRIR
ncbi:MAG TPA: hypothetical protein VFE06_02035 [Acidobacteriaceae bacterium]|jgi:hypothetical protein|nr:hypothetical protein [Acidobacteriaceae bacterium]